MVHPCDGEAWQQFDEDFSDFASDSRNVRLFIATGGFTPYSLGAAPYTCWPVFVAPLNLPPGVLLRPECIFLSLAISGPQHLGKNLGISMQPYADEFMHNEKNVAEAIVNTFFDIPVKTKHNVKADQGLPETCA